MSWEIALGEKNELEDLLKGSMRDRKRPKMKHRERGPGPDHEGRVSRSQSLGLPSMLWGTSEGVVSCISF